jgi:hypothetical protein
MIGLIVLRPQRFEAELVGGECGRRIEADWHELVRGHEPDRTGLARHPAPEFFSPACGTDAPLLGTFGQQPA